MVKTYFIPKTQTLVTMLIYTHKKKTYAGCIEISAETLTVRDNPAIGVRILFYQTLLFPYLVIFIPTGDGRGGGVNGHFGHVHRIESMQKVIHLIK